MRAELAWEEKPSDLNESKIQQEITSHFIKVLIGYVKIYGPQ